MGLEIGFLNRDYNREIFKNIILWNGGFSIHADNTELKRSAKYQIDGYMKSMRQSESDPLPEIMGRLQKISSLYPINIFEQLINGFSGGSVSDEITNENHIFSLQTGFPLGRDGRERVIFFNDEKSLVSIAPPGSGKSQCHVIPALNDFTGAAIILDIKGECAKNSAEWRKNNVGPVRIFSPSKPEISSSYNPLHFISNDPEKVWEDSRALAELLVVSKRQSDPTWETLGRQLLTFLIAYVSYFPPEERTMGKILDLISEIGLIDAFNDAVADGSPFPSSMVRTARAKS